jgi:AcrR family transcriptional regulator
MSRAAHWPSQEPSARQPAKRADGRRNRQRLLAAASKLLRRNESFGLAEVAELAGLSTATVYRHFASAEDAIEALVGGFWDDVDQRLAAAGPLVPIARLCQVWVATVLDWGSAIVYLRSREGFLARRAAGDARVSRMVHVAEGPLKTELSRLGQPPRSEELSYALAVWNALADPREILDQRASLGWPPDEIAERLQVAVLAAISAGARRGPGAFRHQEACPERSQSQSP